jgi:hypothetical protein
VAAEVLPLALVVMTHSIRPKRPRLRVSSGSRAVAIRSFRATIRSPSPAWPWRPASKTRISTSTPRN